MPEEHNTGGLEILLTNLEDYDLNVRNYQDLQNAVDSEDFIKEPLLEKLLTILCAQRKNGELKYATHILDIIFSCLKKIKGGQCSSIPNLTPSALLVLNILKTTAFINEVEALKVLSFEILLYYPDETFIKLSENHAEEILELINLYCNRIMPIEIRLQPIAVAAKTIRILAPERRAAFVRDGFDIWFGKAIPILLAVAPHEHLAAGVGGVLDHALDALDLLVDELLPLDYSRSCEWRCLLDSIGTPGRYPAALRALLDAGARHWHRLWIALARLPKERITRCVGGGASPINSMLGVVEAAFKTDAAGRRRAFRCWDALVDGFARHPDPPALRKRMRLLLVPLLANNARTEETALAKLATWWRLLREFPAALDAYADAALAPFLRFCFGRPGDDAPAPGALSAETEARCVHALLGLAGHARCAGACDGLPRLRARAPAAELARRRPDWLHALRRATLACARSERLAEGHAACAWGSIAAAAAELPAGAREELPRDLTLLLAELAPALGGRGAAVARAALAALLRETRAPPAGPALAALAALPPELLEDE